MQLLAVNLLFVYCKTLTLVSYTITDFHSWRQEKKRVESLYDFQMICHSHSVTECVYIMLQSVNIL